MSQETKSTKKFLDSIKTDDKGLVSCIVQDASDKAVLMFAFMNRESLRLTLATGKIHFFSRSRNKLWLKGESSGNVQILKKMFVDCDADCILVQVKQIGNAACHTGMRSCFYREAGRSGGLKAVGKRIFDPEKVYGKR